MSSMTKSQRNDISISRMLICIVSVFLACNFLSAVFLLGELVGERISGEVNIVSEFLICVNSAVNFIIYCVMVKKFRRTSAKLFPIFQLHGRAQINKIRI